MHEDQDRAIDRGRQYLLSLQQEPGYWCGTLEGGTDLDSEYILLLTWLDQLDRPVAGRIARHILDQQRPRGGWSPFPGGEYEVNASVKAYFALVLTGQDEQSASMRLARDAILAHGGADAVNILTRFFLALLGQIPFRCCPAIPPEAILLPQWNPFSMHRLDAWSRAHFVPLSVVWAQQPARRLPRHQGIEQLFVRPVDQWPPWQVRLHRMPDTQRRGGHGMTRFLDRAAKFAERYGIRPLRRKALDAAAQWMKEQRVVGSSSGAVFSPTLWSLIALKCLGCTDASPEICSCHEELESLVVERDDGTRVQPCWSPVWDTAMSLRALAASTRLSDEPATIRATNWLLAREALQPGTGVAHTRVETGGWFCAHHGTSCPDIAGTATVLAAFREQLVSDRDPHDPATQRVVLQSKAVNMAEARVRASLMDAAAGACARARRWILDVQNADGGWGAGGQGRRCLLADLVGVGSGTQRDVSAPDTTGQVLEALAAWGMTLDDRAASRAVTYLQSAQENHGSWHDRWGIGETFSTSQCLVGLTEIGVARDDGCIERGARWLLAHQQSSGGWAEGSGQGLPPRLRRQDRATPTLTAWAILGLLAVGLHDHPSVMRGVEYLVQCQRSDGNWHETEFTGVGLPGFLHLRHQLYPCYFPLLALGRQRQAR